MGKIKIKNSFKRLFNSNENFEEKKTMPSTEQLSKGKDIAIIGMACRLPGANDYQEYWKNLEKGISSIKEVPDSRWNVEDFYTQDIDSHNKSISKWCGLIDNLDSFDNGFFNISPREAKNMDPQQRILMEEAWLCIEDSGVPLRKLQEKRTSVYVGATTIECYQNMNTPDIQIDGYTGPGIYYFMMPNRISYFFGFTGESKIVDTACSSSSVSIHDAKQSLINEDSDYALVSGVHIHLSPFKHILWSKNRMLSPEGKCKTFDQSADGLVPGEGAVVLLLQSLDKAIEDKANIYGVIKGSAVNHGGKSISVSAPRAEAQRDVILSAYEDSRITPDSVSYIEAHGTGTSLGDPIEIEALTQSFGKYSNDKQYCRIGSSKTNIGHLMSSSGIAGLAKVLLMLKHKKIPPSLNLDIENPIIDFTSSPFVVNETLTNWNRIKEDIPLRAGVSSFGYGGVNTHIVVEEFVENRKQNYNDISLDNIFVLSAKTSDSLAMLIEKWREFISKEENSDLDIHDTCLTLLKGREVFPYRVGKSIKSMDELKEFIMTVSKEDINRNKVRNWHIKVGENSWNNHESIQEFIKSNYLFKKNIDKALDDLQTTNLGLKLYKQFNENNWDKHEEIFSFILDYGYISTLVDLGLEMSSITGEKRGVWTSLAISNMLSLKDIIKVLSGQKAIDELKLNRPSIPFFDCINKKVIQSYHFDKKYLHILVDGLDIQNRSFADALEYNGNDKGKEVYKKENKQENTRIGSLLVKDNIISGEQLLKALNVQRKDGGLLGEILINKEYCKTNDIEKVLRQQQILRGNLDEVMTYYVDKARLLNKSQYTFKKFLDDWKKVISKFSNLDIIQMLHDEELLISKKNDKQKEKLILMVVIVSSLQKLNIKWNLTEYKIIDDNKFYELIDLIVDEVLPKEEFVKLLFKQNVSYENVASVLNSRQNRMDYNKSYEIIKQHSRNIEPVENSIEWLNKVLIQKNIYTIDNEGIVEIGECSNSSNNSNFIKLNIKTDFDFSFKNSLLKLWNNGFNMDLDKLYSKQSYRKLQLPVYAFERNFFENPSKKISPKYTETLPENANEIKCQVEYNDQKDAEPMYFKKKWDEKDIKLDQNNMHEVKSIMLFDNDNLLFDSLKKKIDIDSITIILVKKGSDFSQLDQNVYEINPNSLSDYESLLEQLSINNIKVDKIIHKWSNDNFSYEDKKFKDQLEIGLFSIFHLTKAIAKHRDTRKISLLYMFINEKNITQPQYSALNAFLKTVFLENPNYKCKVIEFEGNMSNLKLSDIVLNEIMIENKEVEEILYKDNKRWKRNMEEFSLEASSISSIAVKENGVYVISGGMGGLGLIFAKYLASKGKVKLILTGRSELNNKKEEKIKQLEAMGAEVVYFRADITNNQDVISLLEDTRKKFGEINGVIHSAGIYKSGFVIKKTLEEMKKVLEPKVLGAIYLDKHTENDPLDFFVLFSSISAIVGDLGLSDYAYGNSFLDDYVARREELRNQNKRYGKSVSINWPLWKYGGMQISLEESNRFFQRTGLVMLPTEEGVKFFENIVLGSEVNQCTVCYGDKEKVTDYLIQSNVDNSVSQESNEAEIDSKVLFDKTLKFLKEIIGKEIGMSPDKIDEDASFEKYGIDSLMIHHFNSNIEKKLGSISKTLLFEYRYLRDLTDYFVNNHKNELIKLFEVKKREIKNVSKKIKENREVKSVTYKKPDMKETEKSIIKDTYTSNEVEQDIAIIGISGRYPFAKNLEEFWENLKLGKDCITEIPKNRWDYHEYFDPDPNNSKYGRMYSKWGGFIEEEDMFDPLFFNISPKDAYTMDPQERLVLETVWSTFEDAGYTRKLLKKNIKNNASTDVGVYLGTTTHTYRLLSTDLWSKGNRIVPKALPWAIANRVSYIFDFSGPSIAIDTACSSALTSLYLACEGLMKKECSMAIAGGVNLHLHPSEYVLRCQMNMLSPTGRCHTFGSEANGYVPGEGVGAVLLKPLSEAITDGDNIYAVIKGVSINHGGRTHGFTVPNPIAQSKLISQCLQRANVDARTISYLEAHGTGTSLGDPIEITGLTKAYGEYTSDKTYCSIGSVKSNIGHLEAAAGIAGITKVILQMKNKKLVPSLHSEKLNPNIYFNQTPFYVQRELEDWKKPVLIEDGEEKQYPRRAGLSAFGAGGVNVHVILEEYEGQDIQSKYDDESQIIVLSAKNKERLKDYAGRLIEYLDTKLGINNDQEVYELKVTEWVRETLIGYLAEIVEVEREELDPRDDINEYILEPIQLANFVGLVNHKLCVNIDLDMFIESISINSFAQYLRNTYEDKIKDYFTKTFTDKKLDTKKQLDISLSDIAYTLHIGREPMEERIAFVASSLKNLREKLNKYFSEKLTDNSIYTANIKKDSMKIKDFMKGNAWDEYTRSLIEEKDLELLAQIWALGTNIDWEQYYSTNIDNMPRKISLPTYPFARERYWIDDLGSIEEVTVEKNNNHTKKLHALIDSNESTLDELCFTKLLDKDVFYLRDHVISDNIVLPGVVYLEMARAAGDLANKNSEVVKLKNIVWERPIVLEDKNKKVYISLFSDEEAIGYEISCRKEGKGNINTIHGYGQIIYEEQMDNELRTKFKDIQSIKQKCYMNKTGKDCYTELYKSGFQYGDGFRSIYELYGGEREALSLLVLPKELERSFSDFKLHPTILDGALQTVTGITSAFGQVHLDKVYLPYFIGEIIILSPLTKKSYAHATLNNHKNKNIWKFDIDLMDENGQLLVKIKDFSLRALENQQHKSDDYVIEILRKLKEKEISIKEAEQLIGSVEYEK